MNYSIILTIDIDRIVYSDIFLNVIIVTERMNSGRQVKEKNTSQCECVAFDTARHQGEIEESVGLAGINNLVGQPAFTSREFALIKIRLTRSHSS